VILTRIVVAWSAFTALTGGGMEFHFALDRALSVRAGEAGCFPNLTRMLSTGCRCDRACGAGPDVGVHTLGWSGHAAVGPGLVPVAWMALAFVMLAVLGFAWATAFFLWFRD